MTQSFSLRGRMLWAAALILFVFFGLMGLVLDQAFQQTAEQGVEEKLRIQIYGLLSVTEVDEGDLFLPEALQEPRFNNPGSGLFAFVRRNSGEELWRSPSSITLALEQEWAETQIKALRPGEYRFDRGANPDVFYLAYKVLWLGSGDEPQEFVFVAMETLQGYESQLSRFRNNLWGWLVLVGVVLVIVQAVVIRWGLQPLRRLARDLVAIEEGQQDKLTGDYPSELAGVTRNLNVLIASERTQRDKYRTTLADLAHSIKTPLAILKGSASELERTAESSNVATLIDEQVDRMDEIVTYQLERAMTDATNIIKRSINVRPVVEQLISAMRKIYPNTELTIIGDDPTFFGDTRDLTELLGNLVENACKYGNGVVEICVSSDEGLQLSVADNGSGIPKTLRSSVLERGARLDSRSPGQGIGLAVVAEIVDRYSGEMEISESELGGAKITLRFS